MAPARIRLGTASPGTQATTPETLAQLAQIAQRAAAKKIDILLLPEAYIGGYPRGTAFGCLMGSRSNEGRDEYLRYFQSAVDLGDTIGEGGGGAGLVWVRRELGGDARPSGANGATKETENGEVNASARRGDGTREELEKIARETGVFLITGLIEKAGGSMYCAAVYVCPKLGIIGKRRKVMPTGTERLVWAQSSPSTLRAVSTTIRGIRVNLAAAICWESYMPLVRQSLYAQNINLYLAPTADGRDTWLSLLRTIAIEGRCFVVSANMCVRSSPPPPPPPPPQLANNENAISPSVDDEDDDDNESHVVVIPQDLPAPVAGRRGSCVTEEGFEIALPSSTPRHSRPTSGISKRRQSVFDEDGNEIVLCGTVANGTGTGTETAQQQQQQQQQPGSRRSATYQWMTNSHNNQQKPPATKQTLSSSSTATKTKTTTTPEFVSRGGSSIVSPFGDVLAGPQWQDDEGIICADVDFEDCIRGRLDLDTAGSYSRNDTFKFSVEGLDLSPLPY
ncbi:carbon-nitrogen hydrolase [Podospora didyma]|uniref:Carbon-nitrogen hydrolase n=1 Tax=Podospora didyma TaxID=330526 RepID=A0AAE0U1E4_9PEZI|nr:carbon-nitrogen hydrolase [Podospora didyma]